MVFDHGFYIGTFRDIAFNKIAASKSVRLCIVSGLSIYNNNFLLLFERNDAVALPIPEDPPVIIATLFF
jgi:hypothetical protein